MVGLTCRATLRTMSALSHRVSSAIMDRISLAALARYTVACHRGGTTDGSREHLLLGIRHELSRCSDLGRRGQSASSAFAYGAQLEGGRKENRTEVVSALA